MGEIYDPATHPAVYLQPGTKARGPRYIDSIEHAGMLIDAKHSIAMYVSRAGMAVGPRGPAGHGYDTIIASASDEWTPLVVSAVAKTTFRAPYALDMTNGYVRISTTTAPTGAPLIVDVHMNGTTIFTTKVQIDAAMRTSVGSAVMADLNIPLVDDLPIIPDDAEFLVYVDQIGSIVAGTGLKVALTGEKVEL